MLCHRCDTLYFRGSFDEAFPFSRSQGAIRDRLPCNQKGERGEEGRQGTCLLSLHHSTRIPPLLALPPSRRDSSAAPPLALQIIARSGYTGPADREMDEILILQKVPPAESTSL